MVHLGWLMELKHGNKGTKGVEKGTTVVQEREGWLSVANVANFASVA